MGRMQKEKRNIGEDGVTLVEILAALVILSIVLTIFFSFFTQSATFTKHNKEKLTAVQVAEEVVADIREGKYPDSVFGKKDYSGYEIDIEIDHDGPAGLKKAEIKVKTVTNVGIKDASFTTEMYFWVAP